MHAVSYMSVLLNYNYTIVYFAGVKYIVNGTGAKLLFFCPFFDLVFFLVCTWFVLRMTLSFSSVNIKYCTVKAVCTYK